MTYRIEEIKRNLSYDEDEPLFREMESLARKLKMPMPTPYLSMELSVGGRRIPIPDKNGALKPVIHQRSRSWVRNVYNAVFSAVCVKNMTSGGYGPGKINNKNTGGVVTTDQAKPWYTAYGVDPEAAGSGLIGTADSLNGILVGSGDTAESFEDYRLITAIGHGTGAGQLSHVAGGPHSLSYDAGTKTLVDTIYRYFNNNSGGDITVKEIALYNETQYAGNSTYLWSRDLLGSPVVVPNTGQLKVTYTISMVYPS